jgi:hypothetical protein
MNFGLFQTYFRGVSKRIDWKGPYFAVSPAKSITYEEPRFP